jgi:hypothetical protein
MPQSLEEDRLFGGKRTQSSEQCEVKWCRTSEFRCAGVQREWKYQILPSESATAPICLAAPHVDLSLETRLLGLKGEVEGVTFTYIH